MFLDPSIAPRCIRITLPSHPLTDESIWKVRDLPTETANQLLELVTQSCRYIKQASSNRYFKYYGVIIHLR